MFDLPSGKFTKPEAPEAGLGGILLRTDDMLQVILA